MLCTNWNKSRIWLDNARCRYYGSLMEDTIHVCRDYPLVMPLWLTVMHTNLRNVFLAENIKNWIKDNMNHKMGWNKYKYYEALWFIACYNIWGWRNKEIHEENFIQSYDMMGYVMNIMSHYDSVVTITKKVLSIQKEIKLIRWKARSPRWVKLNSAGAYLVEGKVDCIGVIRYNNGVWIEGFAKKFGACNAFIAEF